MTEERMLEMIADGVAVPGFFRPDIAEYARTAVQAIHHEHRTAVRAAFFEGAEWRRRALPDGDARGAAEEYARAQCDPPNTRPPVHLEALGVWACVMLDGNVAFFSDPKCSKKADVHRGVLLRDEIEALHALIREERAARSLMSAEDADTARAFREQEEVR